MNTSAASYRETTRAKMLSAGMEGEDADYYLNEYPPSAWPALIQAAKDGPDLDGLDDVEADALA